MKGGGGGTKSKGGGHVKFFPCEKGGGGAILKGEGAQQILG